MGYYNSFVVKIWSDEREGRVRGHITHVGSQESIHFLKVDKMLDFIMDHLTRPTGSSLEDEGADNAFPNSELTDDRTG